MAGHWVIFFIWVGAQQVEIILLMHNSFKKIELKISIKKNYFSRIAIKDV